MEGDKIMKEEVEIILCKIHRLQEIIDFPIKRFLGYVHRADEVEPVKALHLLIRLYRNPFDIDDNMRKVLCSAAEYWMRELGRKEAFPQLASSGDNEKNENTETKYLSYDETRDIAAEMLNNIRDDESRIALCVGVLEYIRNYRCGSEDYVGWQPLSKLEEFIVYTDDHQLMQMRKKQLWWHRPRKQGKRHMAFTQVEAEHFLNLNSRLTELQQQVFYRVSRVTMDLQREMSIGNSDLKAFCVEGNIYIKGVEEYHDESKNELLNLLIDATPHYPVLKTNHHTTQEELESFSFNRAGYTDFLWRFKSLETDYHVSLCNPFLFLFNLESTLAPEDMMKIKSEQLQMAITVRT